MTAKRKSKTINIACQDRSLYNWWRGI